MPGKDPKISKKEWVQEFPEFMNSSNKKQMLPETFNCLFHVVRLETGSTYSQSGPPGATTDSKTIDHCVSLMVESHEYSLCAGELKPWCVIQKDE
ncbi:uncharacterized protein PpBr36_10909 [Pyricularia pennisetigena]|uniref:uncharacterized protein n=1 Tax=Pyricularia pennisetigena TaxID=1578925 RepID=UPI00114F879A|nr:uncharacterized protein PpBr36_10909 [Pyricularia pennisetigena]TLS20808.1 hypothetical protein PpBr36_10909 [Pyricularia pennisetigena]